MIYLSQQDKKWGEITMGNSGVKLKKAGCLTTDISMLTDFFGCYLDPGKLAKLLKYSNGGILQWGSVKEKTCIGLEKNFFHTYNESKILEGLNLPNKASILEVNYGWHFVVGVKKVAGYRNYIIIDPIDGEKTTKLKKGYKITGSRLIVKN
jgi:hypothetical protein